jgi:hypothetical protein
VVTSHGVAHVIRLRSRAAPPARTARGPSESAARSVLRCLLRHVAPAAPPEHASHERSAVGDAESRSAKQLRRSTPFGSQSPIGACSRRAEMAQCRAALHGSALWPASPAGSAAGGAESRRTRAAPPWSAMWPLASEPSSVVLSSSSVAMPCGPQSPAVGGLRPAVPSRVCNRSRIGGVADDVVVVRSSPSGPEMSQTSQAHAHRRGMDVCRNSLPRGTRVWTCLTSSRSGVGTAPFPPPRALPTWVATFSAPFSATAAWAAATC